MALANPADVEFQRYKQGSKSVASRFLSDRRFLVRYNRSILLDRRSGLSPHPQRRVERSNGNLYLYESMFDFRHARSEGSGPQAAKRTGSACCDRSLGRSFYSSLMGQGVRRSLLKSSQNRNRPRESPKQLARSSTSTFLFLPACSQVYFLSYYRHDCLDPFGIWRTTR